MAKNGLISTVGELPVHSHEANTNIANLVGTISYVSQGGGESGIFTRNSTWNTKIQAQGYGDDWGRNVTLNATHSHTVTINSTGESGTHNNIQPYISVYIWQRIS